MISAGVWGPPRDGEAELLHKGLGLAGQKGALPLDPGQQAALLQIGQRLAQRDAAYVVLTGQFALRGQPVPYMPLSAVDALRQIG